MEMDQETKEYLDRKLLNSVRREDVEKMRQETKASFKQLKEENRTQWIELLQGFREEWKGELEHWKRESMKEWDLLKQEWASQKEGAATAFEVWHENHVSSLNALRGEIQSASVQSRQEIEQMIRRIQEEGTQNALPREEWRERMDQLKKEVLDLGEGVRNMSNAVSMAQESLTEGFAGIREEMGATIRFSSADLEKRIAALESRIKALEKMIYR
jgi:hypothetical protein